MNGKRAKEARKIARGIRKRHQSEIATWPWYKRAVSWLFPKIGERWAARAIAEADAVNDFAERRTYKYIKRKMAR